MNKAILKYGLFLVIWCTFSQMYAAPVAYPEGTIIVADTLQTDQSDIVPRRFKPFNDRYSSEDFRYEKEAAQTEGWWSRFKAWWNQKLKELFNLQNNDQLENTKDLMFRIAGVLIFLLVVFFIFKAVMNREGQWIFGKASDKKIIPVQTIEENIHHTDFNSLIASAEAEGNYRLAIRYYYLWLLKHLSETGSISYDVEKTNSDYQNEISSPDLKQSFGYTSYLYNYIWYGEFPVNHDEFDHAKTAFNELLNDLKA